MNDEQSAELVEELADAMWTGVLEDSTRMERYRLIGTSIMPIIDRLLADRATTVAEPDAETVERVASAISEHGRAGDVEAMARAAIAAMPSCADAEWLDEALDSVHPETYVSYVHQWNSEDGMQRACIRWPRKDAKNWNGYPHHDSVGYGTTRKAAILDAVKKAKEASING